MGTFWGPRSKDRVEGLELRVYKGEQNRGTVIRLHAGHQSVIATASSAHLRLGLT